jgi:hypothetical protein
MNFLKFLLERLRYDAMAETAHINLLALLRKVYLLTLYVIPFAIEDI